MIELDGVEFVVKTPIENTSDMIDYVNQYMIDHDVRNSEGEVVFIEVNITNPIYLLFFAAGYIYSIIQKLLYSIGRQYSIANSSGKQLLNIATNAGLRLLPATPTTIRIIVHAKIDGLCQITTALAVTVTLDGRSYLFHPIFAVDIAAGENAVVILITDALGSLYLTAGAITHFDTDVINLDYIASDASVPGRELETIPALRRRLLARQSVTSSIDQAVQALRNLPGITACNIFYNTNNVDSIFIGTLEILPRHTALYVQGYNDNVAKTYLSYIDRPSTNDTGALTQSYTLLNGQVVSVYIIPPAIRLAYVRTYTSEEVSDATKALIRGAVKQVAIDLDVGSRMTLAQVMERMDPSFKVIGADMSLVSGSGYTYTIKPEPNELITLLDANISVEVSS